MQEIITNKKTEEDIKKQKEKEQALLKQVNKKLEEKKKEKKEVITTSKVINLNVDKKDIDFDLDLLDKITVIDDKVKIIYDENNKPITVISEKEASKLQTGLSKKITEKTQEEIIIKKTDAIISKANEEIAFIISELKSLEINIDKEYSTEKIKEFEKKLVNYEGKIEKLERQYNTILSNTDFINFDEFNDEKLLDVIAYYKYIITTNEQIYNLSIECKKGLDQIKEFNNLSEKNNRVKKLMEYKKTELKARDEDYYEHQKKVKHADKINEEVKKSVTAQDEFIKSLMTQIETSEDRFKDEIDLRGLSLMGNNLLKSSLLMYAFRYNRYGLVLGALLLGNNIIGMRNSILNNQIKKTFIEYKELNKQLYSQIGELKYITDLISDSLNQVEKLKEEFKSRFSEYQDYLPEYNTIYKKINMVIEQLKEKEKQLQETEKKIEKQYETSKVKIKKMESA